MDPLFEKRLRDEVILLHALWHQGPPTPDVAVATATRHHLQPSKSVHFKKDHNRRSNSRKINPNNATLDTTSHDAEWPHPATPPPAAAWPTSSGPSPEPLPLSAEEQSKLAGIHAHQHALKVVLEFFIGNNADGLNEIDSSDDDDGDQLLEEDCDDEEINFFCKVFEDSKLREYYEKNFIIGEFGCLVCGALGGKKMGKKFKGCLPLVQHSITIGKTKKKRAHRAFAQAVCKVLDWEIHRLPEIVSMLSDKFGNTQGNGNGESSVASVQNVDSVKDDAVDGKEDGAAPPSDSDDSVEEDIDVEEPASGGLTTNPLACPDVDKTGIEVCPGAISAVTSTSASVHYHLQPSRPTQFKKKKKKKKKKSKCKSAKKLTNNATTESNSSHGAEWPCSSPPHLPSTSGWPTSWATLEKSSLKPHSLSTEEQLILAGRDAHQHAVKVVHGFFRTNNSDEIDSGSDDDDDNDDDDELMEEDSGGSEEHSFFCKVFEEDTKLREYYVKNFAEGEFSCLICGAMGGKKTGKKFKGCSPLVQHLITITKTKKRRAHRAFGRAVCKVLGWDIDHLPAIESLLSDKTGDTQISLTCADASKNLENPGMVHKQNMEEPSSQELTINSLACPDAGNNENLVMVHQGEQPASEGSKINLTNPDADINPGDDNLHAQNLEDPTSGCLTSISLACADANKNLENPEMVHQHSIEEPASQELTINSLVSPDAGKNENQVEQPASVGSTIAPLNKEQSREE